MRIAAFLLLAAVASAAPADWFGRWDLTLTGAGTESGGWLEVAAGPRVRIVPRVGGVKPVEHFDLAGPHLAFSNVEWTGKWDSVRYSLDLHGDSLSGTATRESGAVLKVAGVRAPELRRTVPHWGAPINLTDDLARWKVLSPTKPGNWTLNNGILANARGGPNLRTLDEFQDFRLDLEFLCPAGSNSGVFLRGRYELQIEEEPDNHDPIGRTGAIYQFLAPEPAVPSRPGLWRKLSVTLTGRNVTVAIDGVTIINAREIPGPTSGGFNSREAEPGPIILQGDHGAVSFRNIVLTPAIP